VCPSPTAVVQKYSHGDIGATGGLVVLLDPGTDVP
jgi:hypothetical protein